MKESLVKWAFLALLARPGQQERLVRLVLRVRREYLALRVPMEKTGKIALFPAPKERQVQPVLKERRASRALKERLVFRVRAGKTAKIA
jgi:hypothetical protein